MDTMNSIVALNIKCLREERRLTLEELARLSRVSKSMLAQIERGEGNPTISTLWKVANGMQVPFDALTCRPKQDFEIIVSKDIEPILEDNGKVRNFPLFPDNEDRHFAIYYIEIDQGAYWNSEPHLKGATEFVMLVKGQLTIRPEDEEFTVGEGESIRFKADVPHSYHNSGNNQAIVYMVIHNSINGT